MKHNCYNDINQNCSFYDSFIIEMKWTDFDYRGNFVIFFYFQSSPWHFFRFRSPFIHKIHMYTDVYMYRHKKVQMHVLCNEEWTHHEGSNETRDVHISHRIHINLFILIYFVHKYIYSTIYTTSQSFILKLITLSHVYLYINIKILTRTIDT